MQGEVGFLSSGSGGLGPHLKIRRGKSGCSRAVAGISEFHSSCDRYLREPLELHKGSLRTFNFQVGTCDICQGPARKRASLHVEGHSRGLFLNCGPKCWVPLQLRWGPQGTSHFDSAKSRLLSRFKSHAGIPLESLQGNWGSP